MTGTTLALDTSHARGSVAIVRGGEILSEVLFDASETHSATLMPAVDACCAAAGVGASLIDVFVAVIGPGSFTGLRIGLATVKGFAAVRRRPVQVAGSLEVLAAALPFAALPVLPLIDARRGEVYAALYDTSSGEPREMAAPFAAAPSALGALGAGPFIVCGSGARRYRAELEPLLPAGSRFAGMRWEIPSASIAALLVAGREPVAYARLAALEPLYIRPPEAKVPAAAKLLPGGGR